MHCKSDPEVAQKRPGVFMKHVLYINFYRRLKLEKKIA